MAKVKKPIKTALKSNGKCFVIMPFGKWYDDYYKEIYIPAIRDAGLEPSRADDLFRSSTIINDIWLSTINAKIILADLTNKNPNVFYELGLAHAKAKPAILVTELIDDIPFDLRSLRIIDYDKNQSNWGAILKERITKAIIETLESPLNTVLPTFLNLKEEENQRIEISEIDFLNLKKDVELVKNQLRFSYQKPPSNSSKNLKIYKAQYYTKNYEVDVTNQLIQQVKNNKLEIIVENNIMGVDPEPGIVKQLQIYYSDGYKEYHEIYNEGDLLNIPNASTIDLSK